MNDKAEHPKAPTRSWASGHFPDAVRRSLDRFARADDVRRVAVMPDIHLGQDICIGVAFATRTLVYPDAVGGDIGCGMAAMALTWSRRRPSKRRMAELHAALAGAVPIQRHRQPATLPREAPDPDLLTIPPLRATARRLAPTQLGTLGGGNHFLELQQDGDGGLWLMVHSGSRGLGQAIRDTHGRLAAKGRSGLRFLDTQTDAGRAYLRDMRWARRFARASRHAMLIAAAGAAEDLCGWRALPETYFDCDHNHIEEEEHDGAAAFIHRKGASAAHAGVAGIIPGSMGTPSFHVTGRGVPDALCSSAHGAGRRLSRSAARARISRDKLLAELRAVFVDPRAAAGLCAEAPSAYKDIGQVMRDQRELVKISRTLTPIMTLKGAS